MNSECIKELEDRVTSADIIIGKMSGFLDLVYPEDLMAYCANDRGAILVTELRNLIQYYGVR